MSTSPVIDIKCGDCVKTMRRFNSEFHKNIHRKDRRFKAIITSPPYNMRQGRGFFNSNAKKGLWTGAALKDGYAQHGDNMSPGSYITWQRQAIEAMWDLLTDDGAIFYNTKSRIQDGKLDDRHRILRRFPVRQRIIWDRGSGVNHNECYYLPTYEEIYIIAKPGFKLRKGASGRGDVWNIPPESNNKHPAPFPLEIPATIIEDCGLGKDDWVLDPFCGSGTTLCAAKTAGVNGIGIDISPEYVEMARVRVKATPIRML